MAERCGHLTDDCACFGSTEVSAGIEDAKAMITGLWRNYDDADLRARAMRALSAVVAAERTMLAADAFVVATTRPDRNRALEELRKSCHLRVSMRGG